MTPDDLPEKLVNLILKRIISVEQIAILRILDSSPTRDWNIVEICAVLRSTEPSIEKRLSDLYATGVLTPPTDPKARFKYSPASDEIKRCVTQLIEFYRTHPYRVIDLIYSRPPPALSAFADAFKLRKDK